MPDEVGTKATRSDVPSADDNLFGDAADDTEAAVAAVAAVADEQDAGDETGSSEDLKVVVSVKGGRATIGVQQPSSDPHIETFDDRDLSGLTQEVLAVIERARAKWEEAPKHPARERPAPPARSRNRREQGGGAGWDRRGRGGATATRDAAAVLRAGPSGTTACVGVFAFVRTTDSSTTRPRNRSGRCSPRRSSWPRSR